MTAYDTLSFLLNRHLRRRVPRLTAAVDLALAARRPASEQCFTLDGGVVRVVVKDPHLAPTLRVRLLERGFSISEPRERVDLELSELPRPLAPLLARRGDWLCPRFVSFEVDIASARLADDVRRRLRRIDALGLSSEVTHDSDKLRYFYERMYLPTLNRRHGERAYRRSAGYLERASRHGHLILLHHQGRAVAGALNVRRAGRSHAVDHWAGGVIDGDCDWIRRGADAALLRETLAWARLQPGLTTVGLTQTHPFASDGLLRFKLRWGAELVVEDVWSTVLSFRLRRWSAASRAAIGTLAPIGFGRPGPRALSIAGWERGLSARGLEEVVVLADERPPAAAPRGHRIVVLAENDAVEHFARLGRETAPA
jgi:hypothetical protein